VAEKKKSKLIRELEKKTGLVSTLRLHYNLRIVTRTSIHARQCMEKTRPNKATEDTLSATGRVCIRHV